MPKPMKEVEDQELVYESFRPKIVVDDIASFDTEPGYVYRGVATNNKHLGYQRNIDNHTKAGFEIVYQKKGFKDDRAFTPDNEQKKQTVMAPVLKTCSDGTQYLLMRIKEEKFLEYKKAQQAKYNEEYTKSVRSVANKQGVLKADGGEINFNIRGESENE